MNKPCVILGTKVDGITLAQALIKAERFLHDGRQHYIVTPNPEIVLHAAGNSKYRAVLNKASLSIPDGSGLIWASKRLHGHRHLKERVAGVDFMIELIHHLSRKHAPWESSNPLRILLLGGKNGAAHEAAYILKKRFVNLVFYALGNEDGPHLKFIMNELIQPNCVFVALGAPKQELWINKNLKKFPSVRLAMGVGGAFDMITGATPRAPTIFRKFSLEWLWRLLLQPKRLPRIFNAAVIFPLAIITNKKR